MKGILVMSAGSITVKTNKGEFMIHKNSRNRKLKEYKDGEEVEVQLSTEGCPYDYTSRCTPNRCDCNTKLCAIIT